MLVRLILVMNGRKGRRHVTCFLGGKMTEQPPSQGRPDDWSRGGYVPGEQYYSSGAGSSRPGQGAAGAGRPGAPGAGSSGPGAGAPGAGAPGAGPGMPTAPLWPGAPQPGAPAQGAAQQRGPQQGAPQQGTSQQGAPPPGVFQQGIFQQGQPQQGQPQQGLTHQRADSKGFFGALFDFSFTSFVTTRIIKVLYALILVLAVLTALFYTVIMFRLSAGLGLLTLIIGDPLFIIIIMAFWRLVLES